MSSVTPNLRLTPTPYIKPHYTILLFRERLSEKWARDNPERYCGWFWILCSSKKFERMARDSGGSRGEGGAPPLCLEQIQARRAEKNFFKRPPLPPSLSKGMDDRVRPLISRTVSGTARGHGLMIASAKGMQQK